MGRGVSGGCLGLSGVCSSSQSFWRSHGYVLHIPNEATPSMLLYTITHIDRTDSFRWVASLDSERDGEGRVSHPNPGLRSSGARRARRSPCLLQRDGEYSPLPFALARALGPALGAIIFRHPKFIRAYILIQHSGHIFFIHEACKHAHRPIPRQSPGRKYSACLPAYPNHSAQPRSTPPTPTPISILTSINRVFPGPPHSRLQTQARPRHIRTSHRHDPAPRFRRELRPRTHRKSLSPPTDDPMAYDRCPTDEQMQTSCGTGGESMVC